MIEAKRHILGLDGHPFLRLERLVQPLGIAPAGHHPPSKLVDDHDFVVADNVILVALEELVSAQRLIDVMDERRIGRLVERTFLHHVGRAQQGFGVLVAPFGEIDGALFLVELIFLARELRDDRVDGNVEIGAVLRRTGDDERRAGFVDEDRVDLIDNREGVAALHHLRHVVLHVVAQIVEAEFVVRAVGDVRRIGLPALIVIETMHDDADGYPEKLVDLAHPLGVAASEIVVDGDDVHALAGERVQVNRGRRDQRLALAGAHFGDCAFMQNQAADQLNVEMTLLEGPLRRLSHRRKGGRDQVVQRLPRRKLGAQLRGLRQQLLIAQRLEFRLQRIDRRHLRPVALQPAVVGRAEDPLHHRVELQRRAEHFRPFRFRPAA